MRDVFLPKKEAHSFWDSAHDQSPLAVAAHHVHDKQLIPILECPKLHVIMVRFDHVHGVEARHARNLLVRISTRLLCRPRQPHVFEFVPEIVELRIEGDDLGQLHGRAFNFIV